MSSDVRIGISGWTYKPWRGVFYPKGLAQKRELAHAASLFRSIEINGTFYSMQRPASFGEWADATPDDFVFAVKGPRYLTHMLKLRNSQAPLGNFFASGVLRLGRKLGPILWQFPPTFRFDAEKLETFFSLLPRDTDQASACGRLHDHRLKAPAWLRTDSRRKIRHAMEIRHESFRDPAFIDLLRKHDVALVCADTVDWPLLMDITSDFVYVRLHGSTELYRSAYGRPALKRWAARITAWREGKPMTDGHFIHSRPAKPKPRDVFLYFDNTDKLQAPKDALSLMRLLGQA
ncbi:Uncharacterized conserved protein YecE, DUF72 family [Enhydrobacter aerosaccus]|uniref:Uncharacterized conserved protein YecE, DUF72 family n=2 Tax=Enhydrobacter aerosaccus TaxID=225324 RepID=A0A1T4T895_9HYPH|nr:DUF72 domain-containing protein [Enhydrobacter aerosaccus]SKA36705.1 Uncharacterized conserved protein YecE, DUF72 family [Enhydrobacter aerosaccus]